MGKNISMQQMLHIPYWCDINVLFVLKTPNSCALQLSDGTHNVKLIWKVCAMKEYLTIGHHIINVKIYMIYIDI